MKLKTLKGHWAKDEKRGVMIERKVGEEFCLDETGLKEAEVIYQLLRDLQVTVVDEKFIPKSGKYEALFPHQYQKDGERRGLVPGVEVALTQEQAAPLLISGHIRPVDPEGWVPKKLLQPGVKGNPPIQMFDTPDRPPKEPWIRRRRLQNGDH